MLNKNQNQKSGNNSSNIQSGGDTIFNLNIENLVINFGDKKQLIEIYERIYKWHTSKGKELYLNKYPKTKASHPYLKMVNSLKSPKEVKIKDIKEVAESVDFGTMSWSKMNEIKGGLMVGDLAENILEDLENLKTDSFPKVVEEVLFKQVPEIKSLEENESHKKNIGGIIYLKQTLAEYSTDALTTPEFLGLEIVKDENSLVNLAINGKLEIIKVRLESGNSTTDHFVSIRVKNNSYLPIKYKISKGQVFENKDFGNNGQNLVSSKSHDDVILLPFLEREIKIDAYCINETKGFPEGEGNVAIFKLENTDFEDGNELWRQRREFLNLYGKTKYPTEE